ncbi:MAG: DUF3429 domain-containing protein [Proteobacteria bacterium]|jgi:hypothetical protein|nr:DUF3429 domain-containing protein [Pseudomonadota bacterium]MDA1351560.1 DUF3429 domain-containing protein [Pseudomonadota bacterium]|tara:strand:+ start:853 stop:1332 length:480 start_codon:yes stop_codon:yes gene_type:complete
MTVLTLIRILGYAGIIPFAIPVWLMIDGFWFGPGLQSAALFGLYAPYIFIAYSAVILSFMSGTLWANVQMTGNLSLVKPAVLMSNFLALSAWFALLLIYIAPIMTIFAVTLLMLGFISLLWAERIVDSGTEVYWRMRLSLTTIVTALHLVVAILMLMEL